jgi:hypothetical protein
MQIAEPCERYLLIRLKSIFFPRPPRQCLQLEPKRDIRRAGPRVAHHVRVSLLCGPAAHAVQRPVGHAVQGQRVHGRGDDCIFSMGQTGQRRGGRGLRELHTVKETKQKASFFTTKQSSSTFYKFFSFSPTEACFLKRR